MAERALHRIEGAQVGELRRALIQAGLPADDLDPAITIFYRLDEAGRPLGWTALEHYGSEALLRSVLVLDERRGSGVGTELVTRVMRAAAAEGVRRLWLLTETAAPFFAGLGFAPAERGSAPEPISQSSEFRTVCPASADCMCLDIAGR